MPSDRPTSRLRELSPAIRLSLTCFVALIAGGYLAALVHMRDHVSKKDDEADFSFRDVAGTYAGVDKPAPLAAALADRKHREEYAKDLSETESRLLADWIAGRLPVAPGVKDPVDAGYDTPPPGAPEDAPVPADVLDRRCTRCHAPGATEGGGIGKRVSLKSLPDLKPFAYAKKLDPVGTDILALSTHTHALAIPVYTLAAAALFFFAGWPRRLRDAVILLTFAGLLADFAAMWLARTWPALTWLIVAGGAAYGLGFALMLAGILGNLWFGRRSPR